MNDRAKDGRAWLGLGGGRLDGLEAERGRREFAAQRLRVESIWRNLEGRTGRNGGSFAVTELFDRLEEMVSSGTAGAEPDVVWLAHNLAEELLVELVGPCEWTAILERMEVRLGAGGIVKEQNLAASLSAQVSRLKGECLEACTEERNLHERELALLRARIRESVRSVYEAGRLRFGRIRLRGATVRFVSWACWVGFGVAALGLNLIGVVGSTVSIPGDGKWPVALILGPGSLAGLMGVVGAVTGHGVRLLLASPGIEETRVTVQGLGLSVAVGGLMGIGIVLLEYGGLLPARIATQVPEIVGTGALAWVAGLTPLLVHKRLVEWMAGGGRRE